MITLDISITVIAMGVIFLVVAYASNASNDREIILTEQIIDKEKVQWFRAFSDHLRKLFSAPCPTCATKTIIAEGITKEIRFYPSQIENFSDESLLLTTKSFTRYCPKCEKLFDSPVPMKVWETEDISQQRAFQGGEPFTIIQTHQNIYEIVYRFAEEHFETHDQWDFQPGKILQGYEKLLGKLKDKAVKYSRLLILGWIFVPIGCVLFFLWLAIK